MVSTTRGCLLGLIVVGLLLGLVGMHHLAVSEDDAAAGAGHVLMADGPEPGGAPPAPPPHDQGHPELLHLCLAVLTAAAALLVVMVAWSRVGDDVGVSTRDHWWVRTWSRGPPLVTGRRLALLCVLRT